jgi:hypothetical protein
MVQENQGDAPPTSRLEPILVPLWDSSTRPGPPRRPAELFRGRRCLFPEGLCESFPVSKQRKMRIGNLTSHAFTGDRNPGQQIVEGSGMKRPTVLHLGFADKHSDPQPPPKESFTPRNQSDAPRRPRWAVVRRLPGEKRIVANGPRHYDGPKWPRCPKFPKIRSAARLPRSRVLRVLRLRLNALRQASRQTPGTVLQPAVSCFLPSALEG